MTTLHIQVITHIATGNFERMRGIRALHGSGKYHTARRNTLALKLPLYRIRTHLREVSLDNY